MRITRLVCCLLTLGAALAVVAARPAAAADAVSEQIARLRASDPEARGAAMAVLRGLGKEAAEAVPALAKLLDDRAEATVWDYRGVPTELGRVAAWALASLGPAGRDALLAALADPRANVRANATAGFGWDNPDSRAIAPLVGLTSDADARVRAAAIGALDSFLVQAVAGGESLGDSQPRIVVALRKALSDPVWEVRANAAGALPKGETQGALDVLLAGLRDKEAEIRADAAERLSRHGELGAVAPLIGALGDGDPAVRSAAAQALGEMDMEPDSGMGPESKAAKAKRAKGRDPRIVPALTALLRDSSPEVRASAVSALGWTHESRALSPLLAAAKDGDPAIVAEACRALGLLDDTRAVPALVGALKHRDPQVRSAAVDSLTVYAMGMTGAARKSAFASFLPMQRDPDPGVRSALVQAAVYPEAPELQTVALSALSKDASPKVRAMAAFVLGQTGGAKAIGPLIAALKDASAYVRARAAEALGRLAPTGAAGKRVQAALTKATQDVDEDVRAAAAGALYALTHPRTEEGE